MAKTKTQPQQPEDDWWMYDDSEEPRCSTCEGEGGDPLNDFCLPCPECGLD